MPYFTLTLALIQGVNLGFYWHLSQVPGENYFNVEDFDSFAGSTVSNIGDTAIVLEQTTVSVTQSYRLFGTKDPQRPPDISEKDWNDYLLVYGKPEWSTHFVPRLPNFDGDEEDVFSAPLVAEQSLCPSHSWADIKIYGQYSLGREVWHSVDIAHPDFGWNKTPFDFSQPWYNCYAWRMIIWNVKNSAAWYSPPPTGGGGLGG